MHFLFGIRYQGNWPRYEASVSKLASLFSGKEVEVTMSHPNLPGNNKRFIETKYLQVIRMLQVWNNSCFEIDECKVQRFGITLTAPFQKLEDIVPCFNLLVGSAPNSIAAKELPTRVLRRALRVVHCLELRTQELMNTVNGSSTNTNSFLAETLLKLQAIKEMLEGQVKD